MNRQDAGIVRGTARARRPRGKWQYSVVRVAWLVLIALAVSIGGCSSRDDRPAATDAGGSDARVADAGGTDSSRADARGDAGRQDAGGTDAGSDEDAGRDAGRSVDAGRDAGPPDAGRDAGGTLCDLSACTPTCFRPYDCAPACGAPAESCGCCPCIAGAVDTISCP